MRRAGIAGTAGRPKWKRSKPDSIAADHVERKFARTAPNQLWVTDVTKHLQAVADELNDRPRKALDWNSPTERIVALLNAS